MRKAVVIDAVDDPSDEDGQILVIEYEDGETVTVHSSEVRPFPE